jgi:DNA processing protein
VAWLVGFIRLRIKAREKKSQTIAVSSCGLANTYPPENFGLRKRIAESGAVVSEFPMTQKPDKYNFPARNRLISGLSIGTLVVEAGEKTVL